MLRGVGCCEDEGQHATEAATDGDASSAAHAVPGRPPSPGGAPGPGHFEIDPADAIGMTD